MMILMNMNMRTHIHMCMPSSTLASIEKYVLDALGLAHNGGAGGVRAGVYLLAGFAEEAKALDRARLCRVALATGESLSQVLALIDGVLRGTLAGGMNAEARTEAAACLSAWLELRAAGRTSMSLSTFAESYASLLEAVLALLKENDGVLVSRACDALEHVLQNVPECGQAECAALAAACDVLIAQQHRLAMCPDDVICGLCRVAQAIAEGAPEVVVGSMEGSERIALGLAKFMLQCAALEDQPTSIAESAAEYFMLLNTVPMQERHAQLREPLFNEVLIVFLRRVQFSPEYDALENVDPDESESFRKFREQTMSDILGQTYGILRLHYLRVCGEQITSKASWQVTEAGMFALRCAANSIKMRFYSERLGAGVGGMKQRASTMDPAMEAEARETAAMLRQIFDYIIIGEMHADGQGARVLTSNEMSISHCTSLIGAYAFWFAKHPDAPIEGALVFCIRALLVGRAASQAALAFRAMCSKCADVLTASNDITPVDNLLSNSEKVLSQMMVAPRNGIGTQQRDTSTPSSPTSPLSPTASSISSTSAGALDDEKAVVEGLSRIISSIQSPENAMKMARRLCHPLIHHLQQIVQQLQQLVAHQPGGSVTSLAIGTSNTLHLFASAVRFLDLRAVGGKHPVMGMLEEVWPALQAIGASVEMRATACVVEGLCELLSYAMKSVGVGSAPLLPALVDTLLPVSEAHGYACLLDTFATAAEILGETGNPNIDAALHRAITSSSSSSLEVLRKTGIPESPELARALLEMAHRFALFAPGTVLISNSLVVVLIQMAIAAGACRETDLMRSAYFFLAFLLSPGEKALRNQAWKDNYAPIRGALAAEGASLVRMALVSLAETAPRQLFRQLAGILHLVIDTVGNETFYGFAAPVLSQPDFPGVSSGHLLADASKMFLDLMLKRPPLARGRFDALVSDFAGICRGESTQDVLIAYAI